MTTVAEALAAACAAGVQRLDAQLLLAHHLRQPRAWLIAHDDAPLDAEAARRFEADCARRAGGEPLAYIIGAWSFRGLALRVTPAALIPRPETEVLVDWALQLLAGPLGDCPRPRVADIGTGSGAIALAVALECARACVVGSDISAPALGVARANAAALHADVEWLLGDGWSPLDGRQFDLVVSNPPYVGVNDPHLADLTHEPTLALTAGADGLAVLRELVADAPGRVAANGWLLLEHGHDQAPAVRAMLQAQGFDAIETRHDLAGLARCTGGRRT